MNTNIQTVQALSRRKPRSKGQKLKHVKGQYLTAASAGEGFQLELPTVAAKDGISSEAQTKAKAFKKNIQPGGSIDSTDSGMSAAIGGSSEGLVSANSEDAVHTSSAATTSETVSVEGSTENAQESKSATGVDAPGIFGGSQGLLMGALGVLALGGVGVAISGNQGSSGSTNSAINSSPTPDVVQASSNVVSVQIAAGPVLEGNDFLIEIRDLSGNLLSAPIAYDATGHVLIDIGDYQGGVVVIVKNGGSNPDFMDEASTQAKDIGVGGVVLMAVAVLNGTNTVININPLTTISSVLAGFNVVDGSGSLVGLSAAEQLIAIETANANVAQVFGIPGVLTDMTAITTVDASGNVLNAGANILGVILAAMSGIDSMHAGNMAHAINLIAEGIYVRNGSARLDGSVYTQLIQGANVAVLSDSNIETLRMALKRSPTLNLGSGVSNGATASEATAASGVVTVNGESGSTIVVSFTNGSQVVTKTLTGTGSAQAVVLTSDDLITLGNGSISVNSTSTDAAGNVATATPSAFVLDTVAPNPTVTYSAAENQSAVATVGANESVTWALGSGADTSLFQLNASGALTFINSPNYEDGTHAPAYTVNVLATDTAGNATNQVVTVNVTDVNETPVTGTAVTGAQTAVVGQLYSYTLPDTAFSDPDTTAPNNTLTWSATQANGSALPSWLIFDAATRTFSGTATATGSVEVKVIVTDGGGLSAEQSFTLTEVAHPTFSSTLSGTSNLDTRSDIVITASEAVTAVAGKNIHIVADGGDGYLGVTSTREFVVAADSSLVTINGSTITIDPDSFFMLALGTNYHITIDEGAFTGNTTGLASQAISSGTAMAFSTVTPGEALTGDASTGGFEKAVNSTMMNAGTDAVVASSQWLSVAGVGDINGTDIYAAATYDLSGGSYVMVGGNDDNVKGGSILKAQDGIDVDTQYWVNLTQFGVDDAIYVQDQYKDSTKKNDLNMGNIIFNTSDNVTVFFAALPYGQSQFDVSLVSAISKETEDNYELFGIEMLRTVTSANPVIAA